MSSALYSQATGHRAVKYGSGVGFPGGTQRAALLLAAFLCMFSIKDMSGKKGTRQKTSSPVFSTGLATHSCLVQRSSGSPGTLGDRTAAQSTHAEQMTSAGYYLHLFQLQTTALISLWTKPQHHPSLSQTAPMQPLAPSFLLLLMAEHPPSTMGSHPPAWENIGTSWRLQTCITSRRPYVPPGLQVLNTVFSLLNFQRLLITPQLLPVAAANTLQQHLGSSAFYSCSLHLTGHN